MKQNLKLTNSTAQNKVQVVPHLSSGIVERAKLERAWKSPHARKGDTKLGERKVRDCKQSPSFWTYALLSQRKTPIGSSRKICQKRANRYQHSTWSQFTEQITRAEQITRVALVEATKKKANPATDEIGVENRNRGLAWSQSGNNRTVARLLSLFKSYHQGRNYALQSKDSHYLQKNKRQLKFMSSHDWVTSQFSIVDIVLNQAAIHSSRFGYHHPSC